MLIVMAGLPGTGKSTLAAHLARMLAGLVLSKDTIRAALFPGDQIEYSTEQDDFCMSILLEAASYLLKKDPSTVVIVDGRPFSRRAQVLEVERTAAEVRTPLKVIECVCAEETARHRLDQAESHHLAANRNFALYQAIKASFEPIREPKLVVNTDSTLAHCLRLILTYLLEGDREGMRSLLAWE